MAELAVVGHIAIDEIISLCGERVQLGGPPTYISLVAQKLMKSVKPITKVGRDISKEFISELNKIGINAKDIIVDDAVTTRFVLDYRDSKRLLRVKSVCNEISAEDLYQLPNSVLITPIIGEINSSTLSVIDTDLIALDPQGFVRNINEDGSISLKHWFNKEIIERLTIFKSSEDELKIIMGCNDSIVCLKKLIDIGVDVAIATKGMEGAYLVTNECRYHIPPFKVKVLDPTGAGDAFIGSFILEYLDEENPVWCASIGAAVASSIIETVGPSIELKYKEITRRAEKIYNRVIVF